MSKRPRPLEEIEAELESVNKRRRVLMKERRDAINDAPVEDEVRDALSPKLLRVYRKMKEPGRFVTREALPHLVEAGLLDVAAVGLRDGEWMWQASADYCVHLWPSGAVWSAELLKCKEENPWYCGYVCTTVVAASLPELLANITLTKWIADIKRHHVLCPGQMGV